MMLSDGSSMPSRVIAIHVIIPPTLAAQLDALFANRPLQSNAKVAKPLGISGRTLRRLGDQGKIRYRLKGTAHRQHAREDVEAYLTRDFAWARTSQDERTELRKRRSGTTISNSGRRANNRASSFAAARAREQRRRLIASLETLCMYFGGDTPLMAVTPDTIATAAARWARTALRRYNRRTDQVEPTKRAILPKLASVNRQIVEPMRRLPKYGKTVLGLPIDLEVFD